jgi:hypothetical protein
MSVSDPTLRQSETGWQRIVARFSARQKRTLRIAVVLAVLLGIFPPWVYRLDLRYSHTERSAGYALLVSPPNLPDWDTNAQSHDRIFSNSATSVLIDWPRLFLEWLIVAVLTAVRVFLWPGGTSQSGRYGESNTEAKARRRESLVRRFSEQFTVPDRPGETGPSRFVPGSGGPEHGLAVEEPASPEHVNDGGPEVDASLDEEDLEEDDEPEESGQDLSEKVKELRPFEPATPEEREREYELLRQLYKDGYLKPQAPPPAPREEPQE